MHTRSLLPQMTTMLPITLTSTCAYPRHDDGPRCSGIHNSMVVADRLRVEGLIHHRVRVCGVHHDSETRRRPATKHLPSHPPSFCWTPQPGTKTITRARESHDLTALVPCSTTTRADPGRCLLDTAMV